MIPTPFVDDVMHLKPDGYKMRTFCRMPTHYAVMYYECRSYQDDTGLDKQLCGECYTLAQADGLLPKES